MSPTQPLLTPGHPLPHPSPPGLLAGGLLVAPRLLPLPLWSGLHTAPRASLFKSKSEHVHFQGRNMSGSRPKSSQWPVRPLRSCLLTHPSRLTGSSLWLFLKCARRLLPLPLLLRSPRVLGAPPPRQCPCPVWTGPRWPSPAQPTPAPYSYPTSVFFCPMTLISRTFCRMHPLF